MRVIAQSLLASGQSCSLAFSPLKSRAAPSARQILRNPLPITWTLFCQEAFDGQEVKIFDVWWWCWVLLPSQDRVLLFLIPGQ